MYDALDPAASAASLSTLTGHASRVFRQLRVNSTPSRPITYSSPPSCARTCSARSAARSATPEHTQRSTPRRQYTQAGLRLGLPFGKDELYQNVHRVSLGPVRSLEMFVDWRTMVSTPADVMPCKRGEWPFPVPSPAGGCRCGDERGASLLPGHMTKEWSTFPGVPYSCREG